MRLIRTTVRLQEHVKKAAEKRALEEDTTLQDLLQRALLEYLDQRARGKAKRLIFHTHDLGVPLDNLTRKDYYPEP